MAEIGELLSELREDRNLTQKQLANAFHISGSSISAYEIGARLPGVEVIVQYANYFDVSADYILGLTTTPNALSMVNEEYLPGVTVGDMVQAMKLLNTEQREALQVVLKNMSFYAEIAGRTGGQK